VSPQKLIPDTRPISTKVEAQIARSVANMIGKRLRGQVDTKAARKLVSK
jgi:hypothetical protein